MNRDDSGPSGRDSGRDPMKDYLDQGKQFANDVRDTVSKKVADNEATLRGTLGKAARWVDEKTGGKYTDQITRAQTAVGDGIGRVATAGGQADGYAGPRAPGSVAGDGTETAPRPDGPPPGATPPPPPARPSSNPPADPPTTPQ